MNREYYDERLHTMLQYKRPHGTNMELDWAEKFIGPYKPIMVGQDDVMAYIVMIGESKTLFSAHVDTVHRTEGKQKVFYDSKTYRYYKKDTEPLGADDGAGCWLLLEMIDAGVPGVYVFHRGEEKGGIGSSWIAGSSPNWLKQFDRAIAFDRKSTDSVITYQGYGRCCSDVFGNALADALNTANPDFMYSTDDTGVYTDTAEYTDMIGECTNVSCGYYNEHTGNESLDLRHLFALRDACLAIKWETLPNVRKPGEVEHKKFSYGSWGNSAYGSVYSPTSIRTASFFQLDRAEMIDMCFEDPEAFVDLLRYEVFDEPMEDMLPLDDSVITKSSPDKYATADGDMDDPYMLDAEIRALRLS